MTLKAEGQRGGDAAESVECMDSHPDRDALSRFDAFYDYAFHRVYRYARRRMENEAQAQSLCRLVLIRAMNSLGGIDIFENRVRRDETEFAFWLYCLTRRTADQLCEQIGRHPELIGGSDLDGDFEDPTLEILRGTRSTSVSMIDDRVTGKA